jgi:hypothetical protein
MSRTIEEVRGLNDPQKAYKWEIILPDLGTVNVRKSPDVFQDQDFARLTGLATTEINQRASSILGGPLDLFSGLPLPRPSFKPSLQVEEVQGLTLPSVDREAFYEAGRNTYFPSLEDVNTFSVVFYHDASNNLPRYLMAWKRRIVAENGTKGLPGDYKESITVILRNGYNQITNRFFLEGCFPTSTSGYELNNNSENIKLTQEFSIDRISIDLNVSTNSPTTKQQIEDRLGRKDRQITNSQAGFDLIGASNN